MLVVKAVSNFVAALSLLPELLAAQSPGTRLIGWSLGVDVGTMVVVLRFLVGCGLSSSGSFSCPSD